MQTVDSEFFNHLLRLCNLGSFFEGARKALDKVGKPNDRVTDGSVFLTQEEAELRAVWLAEFGLPRSGDILREWAGRATGSRGLTPEVLMPEFRRSVERELRANLFLHVEEKDRKYFEGTHHFGETVSDAFPSAINDIEEASKCFALSRYTACVFHLMRVLEVGLDALKKMVGLTAYSPTWKVALDQITKSTTTKPEKDKTSDERSRDRFILDAVHYLHTIKDATRNPVVHKPARTYTDETAQEVYIAMRAFMRHLSTKLSE